MARALAPCRSRANCAVSCRLEAEVDNSADVLAVDEVLVAAIDLLEAVPCRDHFLELYPPLTVKLENSRDVGPRIGRAVDAAGQSLVRHCEREEVELDVVLRERRDRRRHEDAALA